MQDGLAHAANKARRMSARETFATLDAISRTRALTNAETTKLAYAIKIIDGGHPPVARGVYLKWTVAMDRRLKELRKRDLSFATIARSMGLTKGAVAKRYYRLEEMGEVV